MTIWNIDSTKQATKGKYSDNAKEFLSNNIQIDSRLIQKGDIFIALKGESADGHSYVKAALEKGASLAICSEKIDADQILYVEDTLKALENLGKFNRDRVKAKRIGVTGSMGKTTTKEALHLVFSAHGKTHSSQGNFNNHLGVPITLATMPLDTEYAIFEMGMNHAMEIDHLTKMVIPDIAIITTVDAVHLEFFDSVESIAKAKAEIFNGLTKEGTAILNKDNKYYNLLHQILKSVGIKNPVCFGETENTDSRMISFDNFKVKANICGDIVEYTTGIPSKTVVKNTLAALAAAKVFNLDLQKSCDNLSKLSPPKGRGKISHINKNNINFTIIDDSYNAGPASVKAAIENLIESQVNGRKIVILANMNELGNDAKSFHIALKDLINNQEIDGFIAMGHLMKELFNVVDDKKKIAYFEKIDDLITNIFTYLKKDDNILIKGSNGTMLYKLVDYLVAE